jgi:hypothetical protein
VRARACEKVNDQSLACGLLDTYHTFMTFFIPVKTMGANKIVSFIEVKGILCRMQDIFLKLVN